MSRKEKIHKIKTNVWLSKRAPSGGIKYYDDALDALVLYIESPKDRIISHYVNDNVSLLYRDLDNELVGIRLDNFYSGFVNSLGFEKIYPVLNESDGYISRKWNLGIKLTRINNSVAIWAGLKDINLVQVPLEYVSKMEFESIHV